MNGIIIIDKPCGKTSHDMVGFIRRLTGIKKVGHTGTLDPEATGVLPVCIGNATKACELLTCEDKRYVAELALGMTTDTLDAEGEILTEQPVLCDEETIKKTIESFIGEIWQIPPMFSAIKKDGKKLYELARQGISIEREKRKIVIHDIRIIEINMENQTVSIDVSCSKGTYIRTLCDDIGMKLGCGAYMNKLRRVKSGKFSIEDAYKTEEIEKLFKENKFESVLVSVDNVFCDFPKVVVDDRYADFIKNGVRVRIKGLSEGQTYRVYDRNKNFLSLSKCIGERLTLLKAFWN